ncbi:probable carboxylesterase 2 [Papaver somniferum]|uniref:probable carboxylesterase 2 n=1 Tax=Papaver somniferum TaxID=3469 RepID=UPI000E704E80|nr:probable carboxylesterase 2 [Papaver somniferum]
MEGSNELAYQLLHYLKVYKDGRVERLPGYQDEFVPPSIVKNSESSVLSKDVVIVSETGVSARLYLAKSSTHQLQEKKNKLPLLIYFHGGAFCTNTSFNPKYHNYVNSLVSETNVVAVSVEYRRAPEHPLPVAYEDSWTALQWVLSHSTATTSNGQKPETWLNEYADFGRVFLAGDSAGANIAHNMAIRAGISSERIYGLKFLGVVLVHPYFWGMEPIGLEQRDRSLRERIDKLWLTVCPSTTGNDDPLINPATDPNLSNLGCNRVLICVAEKDLLRYRGLFYGELLRKSGWKGVIETMETEGEGHVFHLFNPSSENAVNMLKRLASFVNQDD